MPTEPAAAVHQPGKHAFIDPKLVWTMAIANCVIVSNIYYNQPLLVEMMQYFKVSQDAIGWVPIVTQAGYALGLLFAVPLGDMFERKKLILLFTLLASVMLALVALSSSFTLLLLSSLFLGVFSMVPQMLIPFAANLANPAERGKIVGMVMSGLLVGILLSRTFAGFMGDRFGWQSIFWTALGMLLVLIVVLYRLLPESPSNYKGSYGKLLHSIYELSIEFPELRAAAFIGGLLFGAIFLFWPVLIFILRTPPYHYGASEVGLFGLLGAGGALAAPIFGHLADRIGAYKVIFVGIFLEIVSFIILFFWGFHMAGLIAFVILVDLAQQLSHISNQTRVFALKPEARSRLNTVYMFTAFTGAALGSALGSYAWQKGQMTGICMAGFGLLLAALLVHVFHPRTRLEAA